MTAASTPVRAQRGPGVVIAALMPHAPVLVPAVGGARLSKVAATLRAVREVARRVVAANPESLVAVSPHSPQRAGSFGLWTGHSLDGTLAQFGAPEARVRFPIDQALSAAIAAEAAGRGVATWEISGRPLDHGAVVPLWFLAEAGWSGPTVLLGLGAQDQSSLRGLGEAIAAAATRTGRSVALLASGDMSHRLTPGAPAGFDPRARSFDAGFIALLRRGHYQGLQYLDPGLQQLAAEDVFESVLIAVVSTNWSAKGHEVLGYEGPFGVGYGVAVLFAEE